MSNYTQVTYFAPKDALTAGDANKRAKGVEIDAELAAISTAISSKLSTADLPTAGATTSGIVELATSAETITGTDTTRAVTPAGLAAVTLGAISLYEKAANESVSGSTTYQADDHLVTASLAAGTYLVEVYARGGSTSTGGMKFRFAGTATIRNNATLDSCGLVLTYNSGDGAEPTDMQSGSPADGVSGFSAEATSFLTLDIRAKIVITVAGTLQLEWAQQNAAGVLTLNGGSWMAVRRVA